MYERFTDRARKVMQLANQEALRFNHEFIGTEHILLGLIQEGSGVAANVLKNLDIDLRKIRLEIEKIVQTGPDIVISSKLPQTPRAKKVIEFAIEEARNLNHNYVGTEHLLLGLLREQEGVAAQVLMNLGLKLEDVREEVLNLLGHNMAAQESSPKNPTIDTVGRDLTELARQGQLDPVFGRREELSRLVRILLRRGKNCPILLGEAGVGKTAVVRGLAHWLVDDAVVPPRLDHFRLVSIDLGLIFATTKSRSQIGDCLRAIANEARRAGNIILFLDDLHLWARDRTVLTHLALACRNLQYCLSATTPAEFSRVIEKVSTLGRFFTPVAVGPLPQEDVFEVLRDLRRSYEKHHRVQITDESLHAAVALAVENRGATSLIDRALDLLDEAGAEVSLRCRASRPPELKDIDGRIEQLIQEKEAAVAEQDFDKAAHLRDQADKLKMKKETIIRAWLEGPKEMVGVVDEEVVRQVGRTM
jgi:ATP-dependent Clp protease ATP-binding subunit ClpC